MKRINNSSQDEDYLQMHLTVSHTIKYLSKKLDEVIFTMIPWQIDRICSWIVRLQADITHAR